MLSTDDFDRLFNDPRLGYVERFFQPIQSCYIKPLDTSIDEDENSGVKDSWYKTSSTRSSIKTKVIPSKKRPRTKSCKCCSSCLTKDCGHCVPCLDKPRFGGRGIRKQRCSLRPPCKHYNREDFFVVQVVDESVE